ncbi:protein SULFUR DEFICIENCY-INDUCED 1-like [Cynara cardunculus var. scolymus]|uniref:protein SULFUR DEFICIENCY-INDUCED 1-like n=1 Tax=Cynara cardunculus var. scolymus TaxID=59895 RepID=UPI000D62883C|nr:protein SULFUR DEFICIENCY-INDUCED 1-like [Cynara cardunculus var. scolymus]
MWTNKDHNNFTPKGFPFSTTQLEKNRTCSSSIYSSPPSAIRQPLLPASENKRNPSHPNNDVSLLHVIRKVPAGDSPYIRAKHVQLVDKNPGKAVSLFWAAINSGDRVDSALKDMAAAMKQLNRSDEAIEAIKSFRHLCPFEAQESLDNIMLELYKRSGRLEEQIELLESKLNDIEGATMQKMNRTRLARSQGKKIQITRGQEYSRLLGNLAWAYLQQDNYKLAEEIYRKALYLGTDKNKQCNLAICLMYMNQMTEAKFLLNTVENANKTREMHESYAKSYERAIEVMHELESCKSHAENNTKFSSFLSRNKATDCGEEGKKGNSRSMQTDAEFEYKKIDLSPFPTRNMPRTSFTQPRIGNKEDPKGGCFRKLEIEQPAEENDLEVKLPAASSETSVIPLMREARKCRKKWGDMMEEEEEEYVDENVDCCNMMDEKMESLDINDGYRIQPGAGNRTVKRSLAFDVDENMWFSNES